MLRHALVYASIGYPSQEQGAGSIFRLHGGQGMVALGFKMADAKWPTIEQAFKEGFPIIIPLGAECKEHGYHLPMNTDKIIAEFLANWVMHNYSALIAPTVTQNFFPAFVEYPGSSTLSYETSVNSIVEMCMNWHQQGARQFYVLNTGISTNKVLAKVGDILTEAGVVFHYFDFTTLEKHPEIVKITEQKGGTHAGEIETSLLLCIKPEVVDLSQALPEKSPR